MTKSHHKAFTSSRTSRPLAGARWLAVALLLSNWTAVTATGDAVRFAEPASGRPVTSYPVDLPITGGQSRTLSIPRDCDSVRELSNSRQADVNRMMDRRLWRKVEDDCWFATLLSDRPAAPLQDFVTDYDFMNARLQDLPIEPGCAGVDHADHRDDCRSGPADPHGIVRHVPLPGETRDIGNDDKKAPCRLRDGVFYGQLVFTENGIRCIRGEAGPSLRLVTTDFADIDGDGYLDAVLRFVPIGANRRRMPMILPLTRFKADDRFVAVMPGQGSDAE